MINTHHLTLWTILGILLSFMIMSDAYMTDLALESGDYYETNPFTNKFGIMAHSILLLGVTTLLTIRSNKECLISRLILCLGLIVWTLNNIYSITLLI